MSTADVRIIQRRKFQQPSAEVCDADFHVTRQEFSKPESALRLFALWQILFYWYINQYN